MRGLNGRRRLLPLCPSENVHIYPSIGHQKGPTSETAGSRLSEYIVAWIRDYPITRISYSMVLRSGMRNADRVYNDPKNNATPFKPCMIRTAPPVFVSRLPKAVTS